MVISVAVAGKGGSGKTTISSLLVRYIRKHKLGPALAVDADPNSNFGESLGLTVKSTIGGILAEFIKNKINLPVGVTKDLYLEYKLNQAVIEGNGVDLIVMGRGEGPQCYCYPNLILRNLINNLKRNYKYVIIDNEAGMEHLSRRTTENIDVLLIVADHSVKGIRTIAKIKQLISELELKVNRQYVAINFVSGLQLDPNVKRELDRLNIEPSAILPYDELVYQYDLNLKPLIELPENSKLVRSTNKLIAEILTVKRGD